MHPEDAEPRNLCDGEQIILANKTGEISLQLIVSTDVLKGTIVSYKGRWPKRSATQSNINILNPGEKSDMGESSSVHGIEVTVTAAH